jgi:hypothetical protein
LVEVRLALAKSALGERERAGESDTSSKLLQHKVVFGDSMGGALAWMNKNDRWRMAIEWMQTMIRIRAMVS